MLEIRSRTNEIVVGERDRLFHKGLFASECSWIKYKQVKQSIRAKAKVRFNTTEKHCTIYPEENGIKVLFDNSQMSITPGQSVVFYDGEDVIGGGIIEHAIE